MSSFDRIFGAPPTAHARANGRVNLIGEHTDYNGGFVLPTTIPQSTHVALRARSDGKVRIWSENVGEGAAILEYELGNERRSSTWIDYVQGVTMVLAKIGFTLSGFEMWIDSSVPIGSGLS